MDVVRMDQERTALVVVLIFPTLLKKEFVIKCIHCAPSTVCLSDHHSLCFCCSVFSQPIVIRRNCSRCYVSPATIFSNKRKNFCPAPPIKKYTRNEAQHAFSSSHRENLSPIVEFSIQSRYHIESAWCHVRTIFSDQYINTQKQQPAVHPDH